MNRVGMPRPARRERRPIPGAGALVWGPLLSVAVIVAAVALVAGADRLMAALTAALVMR